MRRILKRIIVILPLVALEVALIWLLLTWLHPWATQVAWLLRLLGVAFVLFIVSYRQEGAYRVLWLVFFSAAPAVATVAYLMWGNKRTVRPISRRMEEARKRLSVEDRLRIEERQELQRMGGNALLGIEEGAGAGRVSQSLRYVTNLSGYPAEVCEGARYYPLGRPCWQAMLGEMRRARHFIYLEYFIIEDGLMWGEMCEVMRRKVEEGVDVRLIYDDLGSLPTFSSRDTARLDEMGVKWIAFNKVAFISGTLNNRSHRKMLIVDGRVAFSGGINLADEYIGEVVKSGHWKDIGFRICGPAVGNYLHMFAQFWNAFSEDQIPERFFELVPRVAREQDGIVLSYYDSPGNRDPVSNNFYVEMLGNAREYAWFYTPYLMLGDTLMDAFVRAARRGVDVRIIMPGIPDKAVVFRLSRSFYRPLLDAGVKIYQYDPGFVHAKASLYDDEVCTLGTVNLDYRSLYLHFENNSIFWRSSVLTDLKRDYLETLERCTQVQADDLREGLLGTLLDGVLRIFAPLC